MAELIINKVAESGLITLDLEKLLPSEEIVAFDLKPFLFMEMILKEKDFRASMKELDFSIYEGKIVAVTCSADAIIPVWAYMLVAVNLEPFASDIVMGDVTTATKTLLLRNIKELDLTSYADQRVVVKGCGDKPVGDEAYMEITRRLRPIVKSIMYGEPCSTVPVYKRK